MAGSKEVKKKCEAYSVQMLLKLLEMKLNVHMVVYLKS